MTDNRPLPLTLDELYNCITKGVDEPDYFNIDTPFGRVEIIRHGPIVGDARAIEWARENYGHYSEFDIEPPTVEAIGTTTRNDICQSAIRRGAETEQERNSKGESKERVEATEGAAFYEGQPDDADANGGRE